MKRKSSRRMLGNKTFDSIGWLLQFDYNTQKLNKKKRIEIYYNEIQGETETYWNKTGQTRIATSDIIIECLSDVSIRPGDVLILDNASSKREFKVSQKKFIPLTDDNSYRRRRTNHTSTVAQQIQQVIAG